MTKKQRLDIHLQELGLATNSDKARQLIRAGKVRDSHGHVLDKPGYEVSRNLTLVIEKQPRFVSRGGEKLATALEYFPLRIKNRICLDGGISTGGFSDYLLQNGASHIYGIDVGYGQTAWKLRIDPRITLKERTNLRYLHCKDLYNDTDQLADLAVVDVSFISLTLILPALNRLIAYPKADLILLVKPQFEVHRTLISKGGVVRNPAAHVYAIKKIMAAALSQGWQPRDLVTSRITGPAGNHEYLLWFSRQNSIKQHLKHNSIISEELSLSAKVESLIKQAF